MLIVALRLGGSTDALVGLRSSLASIKDWQIMSTKDVSMSLVRTAIMIFLLGPVTPTEAAEYELWDLQYIQAALDRLTPSAEIACDAKPVSSRAWVGLHDAIAELHGGLPSLHDGGEFPNYQYVQLEHIVALKESGESGPCFHGAEARTEFATLQLLYQSGLVSTELLYRGATNPVERRC